MNDVYQNFLDMKGRILNANPTAEVLFLECPMYSTQMWNAMKSHEDPSQLKEADRIIIEKMRDLNVFFHNQNASPTPKLSEDLNKKKTKTRKGHSRHVYYLKELNTDGIHPIDIVSKLWLKKFQKIVLEKCFT